MGSVILAQGLAHLPYARDVALIGVRGCVRPGTAYVIPARAGAWLVGGGFPGSVCRRAAPRRAAARAREFVFFGVRFRGRGLHGCGLLTEIYKMSYGSDA